MEPLWEKTLGVIRFLGKTDGSRRNTVVSLCICLIHRNLGVHVTKKPLDLKCKNWKLTIYYKESGSNECLFIVPKGNVQ